MQSIKWTIENQLNSTPCIVKHKMADPIDFYPYSMKQEQRMSIWDPSKYLDNDAWGKLAAEINGTRTLTEYFDIQSDIAVHVEWSNGFQSSIGVRTRAMYNILTHEIRIIIKPLVTAEDCEEKLIENICNCL